MINFTDAQMLGATDKKMQDQYNYLVELLSTYLTRGKISSVDGNNYIDLANRTFNLGKDADNYFKYDGETFEFKGKVVVTGGTAAKIFIAEPTTPYKVGDLWVEGDSGDFYRCTTERLTGNYNAADWELATKYTDDTVANQAIEDAATAQSAADDAQSDASAALGELDDIASDAKITPVEKLEAKQRWDAIVVEGNATTGTIRLQAAAFGVDDFNFMFAYDSLDSYLNTTLSVFANMTTTTNITRVDWDTAWKNYYDERTKLLNAIAAKAKELADTAQDTADAKVKTFYQVGIPTSTSIGDLWVDTDDDNKIYRAESVGADQITAGEWVQLPIEVGSLGETVIDGGYIKTSLLTADNIITGKLQNTGGDTYFDLDNAEMQITATIDSVPVVITMNPTVGLQITRNGVVVGGISSDGYLTANRIIESGASPETYALIGSQTIEAKTYKGFNLFTKTGASTFKSMFNVYSYLSPTDSDWEYTKIGSAKNTTFAHIELLHINDTGEYRTTVQGDIVSVRGDDTVYITSGSSNPSFIIGYTTQIRLNNQGNPEFKEWDDAGNLIKDTTLMLASGGTLTGKLTADDLGFDMSAIADTTNAATHYYVETASGNVVPKTVANVKTEIVTKEAVETAITGASRKVVYLATGNCNTITEEWTVIHPDVTNAPATGYWYMQTILMSTGDNRQQIAYKYNGSDMYRRYYYSSSWSSWAKIF